MSLYKDYLAKISDPNCDDLEGVLRDFMWEVRFYKLSKKAHKKIRDRIIDLYHRLNLEERQIALQILLKVSSGGQYRDLYFDNLGEIWHKFRYLSNILGDCLFVMEDFDGLPKSDRGPYDLDRIFRDSYALLKKGGSKHLL